MRITEKDMRRAGEIDRKGEWNDEELCLMIEAGKLVLAYLEGMGETWALAASPIRRSVDQYERFADSRRRGNRTHPKGGM